MTSQLFFHFLAFLLPSSQIGSSYLTSILLHLPFIPQPLHCGCSSPVPSLKLLNKFTCQIVKFKGLFFFLVMRLNYLNITSSSLLPKHFLPLTSTVSLCSGFPHSLAAAFQSPLQPPPLLLDLLMWESSGLALGPSYICSLPSLSFCGFKCCLHIDNYHIYISSPNLSWEVQVFISNHFFPLGHFVGMWNSTLSKIDH